MMRTILDLVTEAAKAADGDVFDLDTKVAPKGCCNAFQK